jgi:hypothetical protein
VGKLVSLDAGSVDKGTGGGGHSRPPLVLTHSGIKIREGPCIMIWQGVKGMAGPTEATASGLN